MAAYHVFLGAPGAGKGTQAKLLSQALGLPHISSGDLFREHRTQQTELGVLADEYLARGELVPDDLTSAMIRERLQKPDCAEGAILDGFPRTLIQAKALDKILTDMRQQLDSVLFIQVPEERLIQRLSGRWMCREHGHVYHEQYNPPTVPGVCDIDGSALYQRDDDRPETVAHRIRVYMEQTAPLIKYYRMRDFLIEVDGDQEIEAVARAVIHALQEVATQ